jgi:hypothetical protein
MKKAFGQAVSCALAGGMVAAPFALGIIPSEATEITLKAAGLSGCASLAISAFSKAVAHTIVDGGELCRQLSNNVRNHINPPKTK